MPATLQIRHAADLLTAVPYLIGYHPDDGVVLIGMRDGLVHLALCAGDPAVTATLCRGHGANAAFVIGYGADVPDAAANAATVADELRLAGVRVLAEIRVHEGHYWRVSEPLRRYALPASSVAAATATFHGLRALPSRAAMVAELAAVTGAERAAMTDATRRAEARMAELGEREPGEDRFARLVRRAGAAAVREAERRHRAGGRMPDDTAAWLTVLLVSPAVFAYAWTRLTDDQQSLWTDLVRRADQAYVCAPACLLGFLTWRGGQGALARMALDRALAADPDHEMARLLSEVMYRAEPPATDKQRAA
ncbi:DUF4192 domain-containing protein [Actinoplanes sp. NBRC 103695]|uniref:DUF4192 domain-containing protein n=1 Tax=Actinoplanes sp. NBRC 103695 TaxID=3032202 RepID=UPI0024A36A48|nr:DUF4192 domain-containing protein [Actinoplanes sp. NBRC 103695]GLZ01500.1 hypothetical protein Acsp02_87510 [Actinoplanes sp. NBRC 103695]